MTQTIPAVKAPARRTSSFRTDIQALRALAVSLVVLNHLWPNRLTGGYVGVDVFFVISGFLISRHLVREIRDEGRVRLAAFYARRVRRLLPAALLVAAVSLVGVAVFMPAAAWTRNASEVIASTFYVENWLLAARSVDYSALSEAASVVQHYWSLSVEEQFYLVWPVLLMGCVWVARRRRLRHDVAMFSGVALVLVASLAFSVVFTAVSKNEAYFVTPTRAWEFALGALVGMGAARARLAPPLRGALAWAGLAAIVLAAVVFDHTTAFPGYAALLPALGTAAVILAGERPARWSPAVLTDLAPVQLAGNISYSIYLWHWPLIVLTPYIVQAPLTAASKIGVLAATVVLAYLSKKLIEDPGIRMRWPADSPRRTFALMAAAMAVVTVLGVTQIHAYGVVTQRATAALQAAADDPCYGANALANVATCADAFGAAMTSPGDPSETPWFSTPGCRHDEGIDVTDCTFESEEPLAPTVWLVGDSHAEHWQAAFLEVARTQGWHVRMSLTGGCALVDAPTDSYGGRALGAEERDACRTWGQNIADRIVIERPDMVFTSTFSQHEVLDDGTGRPQADQYVDAAGSYWRQWVDAGAQVYVIRDTPLTAGAATPECLSVSADDPLSCALDRSNAIQEDYFVTAAESLGTDSVRVLDLTDEFCDDSLCYAAVGGLPVFYDDNHIARSYSRSLAPALFEEYLQAQ
ncbi:acyltransferase family protein [Georgenia sp. SYP-B2076]|uniref:acyltransferase family protein n=1 Tax=Georgenia sp. SYP-B2076 TaxID=2495881 RepID=UPI000F8C64F3|nr:acyltransferase family protein [Georgenia sp. SYP-B2076]